MKGDDCVGFDIVIYSVHHTSLNQTESPRIVNLDEMTVTEPEPTRSRPTYPFAFDLYQLEGDKS